MPVATLRRPQRYDRPCTAQTPSASRERMILDHLHLVRYLACKFANRGEHLEDLIQVGTIGLIKAVDRFDPSRGFAFTTYATPTIVGEIKRYFRDHGWRLKVPRYLQELNVAVGHATRELGSLYGRSPTVAELSRRLNVSEEAVLEAQEASSAYSVLSLDAPPASEADRYPTLREQLGVKDASFEAVEKCEDLRRALRMLAPKQHLVLLLRFFGNLSQAQIGARLGVSQMQVSRIQKQAILALRRVLRGSGMGSGLASQA